MHASGPMRHVTTPVVPTDVLSQYTGAPAASAGYRASLIALRLLP